MKLCWANYLLIIVIAVLGFGSMLSACGKKGPLYLPEEQHQAVKKEVKPQDEQKKKEEETKTN